MRYFAVALLLVGCTSSTEKGKLRPEGPPEIQEVFMQEIIGDPSEGNIQFNLAYGCGDPRTLDCAPEAIADLPGVEQPRMKLCCDRQLYHFDDDGIVSNAVIGAGQKIRVIMDELLSGPTVEQFLCGCADPPTETSGPPPDPNCQGGPRASLDPLNCEDNPNTQISEASRFSDKNLDGVPDKTDLLPGVVEVYCDGITATWLNIAEDGWYNPSGNQQVPANVQDSSATSIVLEWEAVGPAIVLQLTATPDSFNPLPSNSDCHLRFREETDYPVKDGMDTVMVARDKDGNPVPEPIDLVTFHTEPMRVTASNPTRNAAGVALGTPQLSVTFNTKIDPATIAGITVTDMAGTAVAGTPSASPDGQQFLFAPATGGTCTAPTDCGAALTCTAVPLSDPARSECTLQPSTAYRISVPTAVTDSFGVQLLEAFTLNFTTGTAI